jgi:hypothetical protein
MGVGMTRRKLPQRRGALAIELEHAGHRFRMQAGHFADGSLGEVFLDARKQNSTLEVVAADCAILISLLLQHGATPGEIGHALRRTPDGAAASLIGAVVDRLAEMEPEADAGVAMNARARFVIMFSPAPHINAIRSLRWLLKIAKRRFGLIAVDAYEDCSSPLEISNRAADEFKALRNEIIAERASHG